MSSRKVLSNEIRILIDGREPINAKENRKLARRMRGGDSRAREEMIFRNLPLILFDFKRWLLELPPTMTADDLFVEALQILIAAVDHYDPDQYTFSTYATTSMRRVIPRRTAAWMNDGTVKQHVWEDARSYNNMIAGAKSMGIPPDPDSIAEKFDLDRDHCHRMHAVLDILPALGLDLGDDDDPALSYVRSIADDTNIEDEVQTLLEAADLTQRGKCLTLRESAVIRARFTERRSLKSVALEMDCERIDIRKIERSALRKLREADSVLEAA